MIDLSQSLEHGVSTYPGFPTPQMSHHITFEQSHAMIADGREYAIDLLTFVAGSATYIDAPRHMGREADDIAALPLERLVDRPAVIVPAPSDGRREYRPEDFDGRELEGAAVLLATGWDRYWGRPEYVTGSPYLGGDAARLLAARGAAVVGIDAVLIDDVDDPAERPLVDAHITLLRAGIPIVENLRSLDLIPESGALFTAVPASVRGVGSFPVRAYAR